MPETTQAKYEDALRNALANRQRYDALTEWLWNLIGVWESERDTTCLSCADDLRDVLSIPWPQVAGEALGPFYEADPS